MSQSSPKADSKKQTKPAQKKQKSDNVENFDFHKNHRERLRNRYRRYGSETFTELEILEMLLYYAVPRKDTKPLAHMLMRKYGTFHDVINNPEANLLSAGAPPAVSFLLSFVGDIFRYHMETVDSRKLIDNYDEAGRYMFNALRNSKIERVLAVLLDSKNRFLSVVSLGEGDFESCPINRRMLVEQCIRRNAATVVMAHNHPDGSEYASRGDFAATQAVEEILKSLGVSLAEHYVVTENTFVGMYKSRYKIT